MIRNAIPLHIFELDIEKLEEAIMIPAPQLIALFKDGRVSSKFAEEWAVSLFDVFKYENSNHRSSDAYGVIGNERFEFSVRTLTKHGIKFQDSKFMGFGRSCTLEDLKASIRRTDRWLIFDIRNFPEIAAYKLKSSTLEHWIDDRHLTQSGLSPEKFERLMSKEIVTVHREFCFD